MGDDLLDVAARTRDELWDLAATSYREVFGREPFAYDPAWTVEFLREYRSPVPDERSPRTVRAVHDEIALRWPWLAAEAGRQDRTYLESLAPRRSLDLSWLREALDVEPQLFRLGAGWTFAGRDVTLLLVDETLVLTLPARGRDTGVVRSLLPWPGAELSLVEVFGPAPRTTSWCLAVPVRGLGLHPVTARGFAQRLLDSFCDLTGGVSDDAP